MQEFIHGKIKVQKSPIEEPETGESKKWQEANKEWWQKNPMRYDWKEKINANPGSAEYFCEIDKRFFDSAQKYLPQKNKPFDKILDYEFLKNKNVLEIGVGHGSHAELIATNCLTYTGIDLTEAAVQMTKQRMEIKKIESSIFQMDAEKMDFKDASFDFIWSWGVIHHSANTSSVLKEMHRVLKPGGRAIVMIYYRSFWKYYIEVFLVRGLLLGQLRKAGLSEILNNSTDGAIARFYTVPEWRRLTSSVFKCINIFICGQKTDLLLVPGGKFKQLLLNLIPDGLARFFTNALKFGTFLVVDMEKI